MKATLHKLTGAQIEIMDVAVGGSYADGEKKLNDKGWWKLDAREPDALLKDAVKKVEADSVIMRPGGGSSADRYKQSTAAIFGYLQRELHDVSGEPVRIHIMEAGAFNAQQAVQGGRISQKGADQRIL